ncbi:DUF2778 domain-containing protein [Sphingomonas sp. AR_OL41]|uniref:tlde1 domain-containing protein n=1 Tax=Sphingomonas sp. AR_OL41 TaxID=3042729 RepID=UPI002480A3CF|nr:tlde1 domain-containing protein [Sphingomonas sp. AR_OL41]MDH7973678.1 DUF2778 domain-containing protein [Sphingomonas sp. AR_OL41]
MLTWDQSAGTMTRNGELIGRGYSGNGRGVNNPAMQAAQGIGPLPQGRYDLTGVKDSPNTGPFTIVLEPSPGTNTLGRSAFRIHGDNRLANQSASHGCIILPRAVREAIWRTGDRQLTVVA